MLKTEIGFTYHKETGRTSADCNDIYNWLVSQNEKVAREFKAKWRDVEKYFIKKTEVLKKQLSKEDK